MFFVIILTNAKQRTKYKKDAYTSKTCVNNI